MNLLPHVHFLMTSPLPAEQAIMMSHSAEINVSGRNYLISKREGEYNSLRFRPERKLTFYHNSFLPTIKMDFHCAEEGTAIDLYAKLLPEVRIFLVFFVLFGLTAEVCLICSCIKDHYLPDFPFFMPGIMSIAAYAISYICLYASAKSFQLQFEEYMKRKN